MARDGYRIFDADTHIIEPVEPIEEYLTAADRAKLTALGPWWGALPQRPACRATGSASARDSTAALAPATVSRRRLRRPAAHATAARRGT